MDRLQALLAAMTVDMDWPNAREGGRLHGREAVRVVARMDVEA